MNTVRVLGCDPSLRNFGLVLAEVNIDDPSYPFEIIQMNLAQPKDEATKAKTVRKNSDDLRRASELSQAFQAACKEAVFAICEVPVGSQSSRAMVSYGICIGVLSAAPIPLIQVTPSEVKMAGCGVKTATKGEMIEAAMNEHPEGKWLTRKLKGEVKFLDANEHLADATFAIKAGLQTAEFRAAASMLKNMQSR